MVYQLPVRPTGFNGVLVFSNPYNFATLGNRDVAHMQNENKLGKIEKWYYCRDWYVKTGSF